MSTGERLARVSRMRTLSALLDQDVEDEEQLSEDYRVLFAHVTAAASKNVKDSGDVDDAPRRNEFLCVECEAHESEVFCEQCHDYFCELCCGGQHRKGNRRKHTFQPRFPTAKAAIETTGATTDVEINTMRGAGDYDVR